MAQFTLEKLEAIFSYHKPSDEEVKQHNAINEAFLNLALLVDEILPNGAGKTVAIRKLSETRMATNHALQMKGDF